MNSNENLKIFSPVVKLGKRDFVYKALFFFAIFTLVDLLGYYVPSPRRGFFPSFPYLFTYFGMICGVIVLFTKTKSHIEMDFQNKILVCKEIGFFRSQSEYRISLKNFTADFSKHKSGRNFEWVLTITENGKKVFREKEDVAVFNREILKNLFEELENLANDFGERKNY